MDVLCCPASTSPLEVFRWISVKLWIGRREGRIASEPVFEGKKYEEQPYASLIMPVQEQTLMVDVL